MNLDFGLLNIVAAIVPPRVAAAIRILAVGISINNPAIAATLYSVTDLGNLGSSQQVTVNGINNNGQAVGSSAVNDSSFRIYPFRTAPNSPIDAKQDNLAGDRNLQGRARAINDTGVVVGDVSLTFPTAFRTAPNRSIVDQTDFFTSLNFASAINNNGTAVATFIGRSLSTRGNYYSYRIGANQQTDNLGSFGVLVKPTYYSYMSYTYTLATDINDSREVVGASLLPTSEEIHAFRTMPNQAINPVTDDLGTLGGTQSQANAINNLGQVVGFSLNPNGETRAFRTNPNSPINSLTDDLGTLGGSYSVANDININGQVVGNSLTQTGERRAFLYEDGRMFDLNSLIPANDFTLNYANGINDRGQIVAGFSEPNLPNRIFLLTPIASTSIPDPMGVPGILLFGAVGAAFSLIRATIGLFH